MESQYIYLFAFVGVIAFAGAANAVADFSGHWHGSGEVKSTIGVKSTCTSIDFDIKQTADEFVIQSYSSKCNLFGSDWGPNTMQIHGADVLEDGQVVGHIDDDSIHTSSPDGGVSYVFNLTKVPKPDGSFGVESTYGTQNGMGTVTTEGLLHH